MNTGFQLFQLQEIDTTIDKTNQRIKDINSTIQNDKILKAVELKHKGQVEHFNAVKNEFERLDADIQSKKNKKSQSESSLYSGTISNPKELQDLQKEIGYLNSIISKMEDELLEKMIEFETIEKELNETKGELKSAISEFETKKSMLNGEKSQLQGMIQSQLDKKESLIIQIDPHDLENYQLIRSEKNGFAVSKLTDGSCSVCGASLTASQSQQARSPGKLFYCPSCGRIIYGS